MNDCHGRIFFAGLIAHRIHHHPFGLHTVLALPAHHFAGAHAHGGQLRMQLGDRGLRPRTAERCHIHFVWRVDCRARKCDGASVCGERGLSSSEHASGSLEVRQLLHRAASHRHLIQLRARPRAGPEIERGAVRRPPRLPWLIQKVANHRAGRSAARRHHHQLGLRDRRVLERLRTKGNPLAVGRPRRIHIGTRAFHELARGASGDIHHHHVRKAAVVGARRGHGGIRDARAVRRPRHLNDLIIALHNLSARAGSHVIHRKPRRHKVVIHLNGVVFFFHFPVFVGGGVTNRHIGNALAVARPFNV